MSVQTGKVKVCDWPVPALDGGSRPCGNQAFHLVHNPGEMWFCEEHWECWRKRGEPAETAGAEGI